MLIYHTIYAYMYEKDLIKHRNRNDLEFQLVYQGFKIFGLYKDKIDI